MLGEVSIQRLSFLIWYNGNPMIPAKMFFILKLFSLDTYMLQWMSPQHSSFRLTHWGKDKMAAILQMAFSSLLSCIKTCIWVKISLHFVSKGSADNKAALVQVIHWYRKGNKPLPEPMVVQITDCIDVSLSLNESLARHILILVSFKIIMKSIDLKIPIFHNHSDTVHL